MKRIFISYAREDENIANRLYNDLKNLGLSPWIDTEKIQPGQKWRECITEAIMKSDFFLALLSSHSISKRGYVQNELKKAFEVCDGIPNSNIFIIPIRLTDCEIKDQRLKELTWLDLYKSYNKGLNQLIKSLDLKQDYSNTEKEKFSEEVAQIFSMRGYDLLKVDNRKEEIFIVSKGQEPFCQRYIVHPIRELPSTFQEHIIELSTLIKHYGEEYNYIKGLIVSKSKLTMKSITLAKSFGIILSTYEQLLNMLVNFNKYFINYIYEFETTLKNKLFVDPEALLSQKKGDTTIESLMTYLLDWSNSEIGPNNILLLGEYGLGKTTFVEKFVYNVAKKLTNNKNEYFPIPIIIYLKDFDREIDDLQSFITSQLVNKLDIEINYATFLRLFHNGKIILILDAFDEMAMVVNKKTRDNNFLLLQSLCSKKAKIIITGRPEYFPNDRHLKKLISEERDLKPIVQVFFSSTGKLPKFEKIYLKLFDNKRIQKYLSLCEQHHPIDNFPSAKMIALKIKQTHDLQSLASRPVLLDIIVKTLPKHMDYNEKVTPASLYESYTEIWLEREIHKGRNLIPSHIKRAFVYELAWKMLKSEKFYINFKELPKEIQKFFDPQTAEEAENCELDIMLCSYLHRDANGDFSFAHKTFMEFFCAHRSYNEYLLGKSNPFSEKKLPSEIMLFFTDLSDEPVLDHLKEYIYTSSSSRIFRENITRFLAKKRLEKVIEHYIQCIVSFPSIESKSIIRQLRRIFENMSISTRLEVVGNLVKYEDKAGSNEYQKVVKKVKKMLKVDELTIKAYSNYLKTNKIDITKDIFFDLFSKFETIKKAILSRYKSINDFYNLIKTDNIDLTKDELNSISNRYNATHRLIKELLKKYELTTSDLKLFLQKLRLIKVEKNIAENAYNEREVKLFSQQTKLTKSSAAEILSKSKNKKQIIKQQFQILQLKNNDKYIDEIRDISGIDIKSFPNIFSMFLTAVSNAGIMKKNNL